jgi:Flp pilus assembly protein TadD
MAVAVLCVAMAAYLALGRGDEAQLERAADQMRAGHSADALAELDGLGGQATGRAAALRGRAYLSQHAYKRAAAAFSDAAHRAPNDWTIQRDYAIALRQIGRQSKARARMQRALALNPRMQLPAGFRVQKIRRAASRRH